MAIPSFVRTPSDVRGLFAHLADQERETLVFAYLAGDGRLLGVRHSMSGARGSAQVPLRAVARDAVRLDAVRVAMAHNHPSGDPTPSRADLAATKRLATALAALGIGLVEHLIVGRAGAVHSLRGAGLL